MILLLQRVGLVLELWYLAYTFVVEILVGEEMTLSVGRSVGHLVSQSVLAECWAIRTWHMIQVFSISHMYPAINLN